MLKSFKYRISPTEAQSELINKHIGSSRFVYNLALETKTMAFNLKPHDFVTIFAHLKYKGFSLSMQRSISLEKLPFNYEAEEEKHNRYNEAQRKRHNSEITEVLYPFFSEETVDFVNYIDNKYTLKTI